MNSDKYNRSIVLLCPSCGNNNLELKNGNQEYSNIKCPSCNRIMTKEELIRENSENIDVNIAEVKEEVIKDIKKEFASIFKKNFK